MLTTDLVVNLAISPLGWFLGRHGRFPHPTLHLAQRHRRNRSLCQGLRRRCQRSWTIRKAHRLVRRGLDIVHAARHKSLHWSLGSSIPFGPEYDGQHTVRAFPVFHRLGH